MWAGSHQKRFSRVARTKRKTERGRMGQKKREKRLFSENSHCNRINGELSKQNEKRRMDAAVQIQRHNSTSMKRSQTIWILYKLFRNHGQFLPCLFCSYWVCSFRLHQVPFSPLPSAANELTSPPPAPCCRVFSKMQHTHHTANRKLRSL
jgi:hypothetical protein